MGPIPQEQRKKKQASSSHLCENLKVEMEFFPLPSESVFSKITENQTTDTALQEDRSSHSQSPDASSNLDFT